MYEGEWEKGHHSGYGKHTNENGDVYEGNLKNGRHDGFGRLTINEQEWYEGGFLKGEFHGKVEHVSELGSNTLVYVNGVRHGPGTEWVNGVLVKGKYKNDVFFEDD